MKIFDIKNLCDKIIENFSDLSYKLLKDDALILKDDKEVIFIENKDLFLINLYYALENENDFFL